MNECLASLISLTKCVITKYIKCENLFSIHSLNNATCRFDDHKKRNITLKQYLSVFDLLQLLSKLFYYLLIISLLAFRKAYDMRKRIAQVLQRNFGKLFANNPSKEICTFLVFLNYTSGYL